MMARRGHTRLSDADHRASTEMLRAWLAEMDDIGEEYRRELEERREAHLPVCRQNGPECLGCEACAESDPRGAL